MSVKVMALCYDVCFLSSCRKAVAVAIADHVDDRGEHAFPSIARIAEKTEFGERAVQYAIRDLELSGILKITEEGGKGAKDTREWAFDMVMLRKLADGELEIVEKTEEEIAREKGASDAPCSRIRVQLVPGRVHLTTDKGAPGAPEPSLTVINHPGASARATEEGRASPPPKSHPAERLVLRTDPEWVEWFALYERLDGKRFVDAFSSQDGMIVYAAKPHKAADPPGLLVTNGKTWQRLMAEREAKEAARVLTAKSKAMTGEAA